MSTFGNHSSTAAARASISVVIPCLNEVTRLQALLDALHAQDATLSEVIVVDNGSTDGSPAIISAYQARHPQFPLRLLSCARPGAAAALNEGIADATGDVIVRVDGHCVPRTDYVRRSIAHLDEDLVGVVGGVWEVAPGSQSAVGRAIAFALTHRLATGGARYRHPDHADHVVHVDTVPFGSFKKSLWQMVGGYDERRTVNEDYVLNYQARRAGRLVLLDPSIRSTYFARDTFGGLARQYFRYGWVKASMLKHYPGAIRWRQIVPGAFTGALIILGIVGTIAPAARWLLAALLATYAAVLLAAATQLSWRTRDFLHIPLYALSFAIIHLAWGFGAAVNIITFGGWPVWNKRE